MPRAEIQRVGKILKTAQQSHLNVSMQKNWSSLLFVLLVAFQPYLFEDCIKSRSNMKMMFHNTMHRRYFKRARTL